MRIGKDQTSGAVHQLSHKPAILIRVSKETNAFLSPAQQPGSLSEFSLGPEKDCCYDKIRTLELLEIAGC